LLPPEAQRLNDAELGQTFEAKKRFEPLPAPDALITRLKPGTNEKNFPSNQPGYAPTRLARQFRCIGSLCGYMV